MATSKEISEIEIYYVDQLVGYLDRKFKDGIQDDLNNLSNIRLV